MARSWLWIIATYALMPARVMSATLNVTTFGATPDGGGDDTAAINNAIQAAGFRDTVYIPPGVYDFSNKIIAKSDMVIAGAGAGATTLRWNGSQVTKLMTLQNVNNVDVSNLTLDGNNSTAPQQGIYATNAFNLNIHDLAVKNLATTTGFSPHGIFFDGSVNGSAITNTTLTNIGLSSDWGAGIRLGHGSSYNAVQGNTIDNTGRGGILLDDDSTNVIIRNNTVTRSGGTGLGIELQDGCNNAIVEDNHIDHWLSIDNSHNLAVRRNVISDSSGTYKFAGIEVVDAHDDVFTDNTVASGAQIGISISGPNPKQRVLFARNSINAASTWGAQIQGEGGGASQMYFYKNTFKQTIANGPNTMFAPQGHGVRFNGNASSIVFDSNLIDSNQGGGIQMRGSGLFDLKFVRNQITNNLQAGVMNSGVASLVWADNIVTGNSNNTQPAIGGSGSLPSGVDAIANIDALVGEPIAFSISGLNDRRAAAASSELSSYVNVLWDFGDGIPSTEFNPMHTFAANGTYLVMMIGWDAFGNATMQQATVSVVPEPLACAFIAAAAILGLRCRARRAQVERIEC